MAALDPPLARLPPRAQRIGRALGYFAGGVMGFVGGAALANPLFHVRVLSWDRNSLLAVVVMGAIGALAAISLTVYDRLRRNLEESTQRLKEAEFAQRELDLARGSSSACSPRPPPRRRLRVVEARNPSPRAPSPATSTTSSAYPTAPSAWSSPTSPARASRRA